MGNIAWNQKPITNGFLLEFIPEKSSDRSWGNKPMERERSLLCLPHQQQHGKIQHVLSNNLETTYKHNDARVQNRKKSVTSTLGYVVMSVS